ncbi:HNH endonuclease [Gluconobacter sp. LMG 1744]|uniref:HNH endonuclease n=1 Tax=Gluconobacter cadivus TaxID=2728101 RepID=UPI00188577EE|nr:HNH endonuclease [Gluconobacter cadivus]
MADRIQSSSQQRNYHYNRTHTQKRTAKYDNTWREFSSNYRKRNPFCVECREEGLFNSKDIHVDHIVPLEKAPDRKYDLENLQSLCRRHHGIKTAKETLHAPESPVERF